MIRKNLDLVIAVVVAILGAAAAAANAPAAVTVVLGVGLIAAPGYLWTEVLLKRFGSLFERVMVGTGIALMLPIFGGLLMFAAGVSLRRDAWLELLAGATIVGAVILAIVRRKYEPAAPETETPETETPAKAKRKLPIRHALIYGAAVVIAAATIVMAVMSSDNQSQAGYTQLWMAPSKNTAIASLGVENQQGSTVAYRLQLLKKGHVSDTWNLTLTNGQTWQLNIPYTSKYSLAANLYRLPNLTDPYRTVGNNAVGNNQS
jgi:hypothetical protein